MAKSPLASSKETKAIGLLVVNPSLTDKQIAELVPCARTSLYRMRKFVEIRGQQKAFCKEDARIPRGSKFVDQNAPNEAPNLEAWAEDDEQQD